MSKAILPDPANVDELGSLGVPWKTVFALAMFIAGRKVPTIPIDAGLIEGGELDPSVIKRLLGSTALPAPPVRVDRTITANIVANSTAMSVATGADSFTVDDIGKLAVADGYLQPGTTILDLESSTIVDISHLIIAGGFGIPVQLQFQDAPPPPTLLDLIIYAILGSNPIGTINQGAGGLKGSKILNNSIPPNKLLGDIALGLLTHLVYLGTAGGFATDNYAAAASGLKIGKALTEFNEGVWRSIISVAGKFKVNSNGSILIGDFSDPDNAIVQIMTDGRIYFGGTLNNPTIAPLQMDRQGNIAINFRTGGATTVDLDALDVSVAPVYMAVGPGGALQMGTQARFAKIYYTDDGSDPRLGFANPAVTLYTVPIGGLVGGTHYRAAAYKCGEWSDITDFIFDADTVATPMWGLFPGTYTNATGTISVHLSEGTSGATIKYTLDNSAPSGSNGAVYVGPIALGVGSHTIKAIGIKAGKTNSAIITGTFVVNKSIGTTTGGSGGTGGSDGGGGGGGIQL